MGKENPITIDPEKKTLKNRIHKIGNTVFAGGALNFVFIAFFAPLPPATVGIYLLKDPAIQKMYIDVLIASGSIAAVGATISYLTNNNTHNQENK